MIRTLISRINFLLLLLLLYYDFLFFEYQNPRKLILHSGLILVKIPKHWVRNRIGRKESCQHSYNKNWLFSETSIKLHSSVTVFQNDQNCFSKQNYITKKILIFGNHTSCLWSSRVISYFPCSDKIQSISRTTYQIF